MMSYFRLLLPIIIFPILLGFSLYPNTEGPEWDQYVKEFNQWKKERVADLNRPLGYLSMVGLYWLDDGVHSVGSASENDIIFPKDMPLEIGQIRLSNDELFYINKSNDIMIGDKPAATQTIKSDADGDATMFTWKSYTWHVIKRGDQYGIRLKDTTAVAKFGLTEIPTYEPKPEWIINGKFIENEDGKSVAITNKVGITYDRELAGKVRFMHNDQKNELLATYSGEQLFIVFADKTTGSETYGGGRFLYIDTPQEGDDIVIDFNRVENPICAFSDYATCPLPRPENFLPFAVTAGEKKVR